MSEHSERTWLRGPLHARPAGLLVRLIQTFDAHVRLVSCEREAEAGSILDLLALAADEGDRIELRAEGRDAALAIAAVRELIERNFDQALVPETGRAIVHGIAVGRAVVVTPARSPE